MTYMTSTLYKAFFFTLVIAFMTVEASAQTAADAASQRREIMKNLFPEYMRSFIQINRGESTDIASTPEKARAMAEKLRQFAALFPAGTEAGKVPDSRARPEIWSKRDEFDAKLGALISAVEMLGTAAETGNVDTVKTQASVVSQTCTGCHGGPGGSGGPFRTERP